MKKLIPFLSIGLLLLSCFVYAGSDAYQVMFETTECNGESGFATVGADQIYKIQSAGCMGPDGKELKQMLLHDGTGSYTVYTLSQQEAENVMKEVKAYMAARRGALERADKIIVKP